MNGHDIIVIGGSAGSVQALMEMAHGLPADLPAAIFVVVHTSPASPGVLHQILTRSGPLPAARAMDGQPIRHGRIYVAPPDRHLLVKRDQIRVVRGPKENISRPAIDPLFRTAAQWYSRRVVAVLLSGNLDDGTVGLQAVRRRHGVAIVQDPKEALFPGMPSTAIENVGADHILTVAKIAPLLVQLATEPLATPELDPPDMELQTEIDLAELEESVFDSDERPGAPSAFSCPECSGVLWELKDGELIRYRCRVGHAYSIENLLEAQDEAFEETLWTAITALKEKVALSRRMAHRMRQRGQAELANRFEKTAKTTSLHTASLLRILRHEPTQSEPLTTTDEPLDRSA